MRRVIFLALIVLVSCAPRGELAFDPSPSTALRPVFVGSTRGPDPQTGGDFGTTRREGLQLARFDISLPPLRQPGDLRYPLAGRRPDPTQDFMLARAETYPQSADFRAALRQQLARSDGEAVVFVHGFNTNFAEGLYRLAQLGTDFDLPETLVYYAWPSRGHVLAYAYDRDSALFARDGLQLLLRDLRQSGARRILLVGHSMGAAIAMETLRQMTISGETETLSRLGGVVLISPDIDVDVFRAQARKVGALPQPFIIFTSQKDKALRLASRLSGERERLGNLQEIGKLADLKVTMIDVGAFDTRDGHFNVADNPALIRLLRGVGQVAAVLEGEQASHADLASGVIMTVQNATQIILSPVGALSGG